MKFWYAWVGGTRQENELYWRDLGQHVNETLVYLGLF